MNSQNSHSTMQEPDHSEFLEDGTRSAKQGSDNRTVATTVGAMLKNIERLIRHETELLRTEVQAGVKKNISSFRISTWIKGMVAMLFGTYWLSVGVIFGVSEFTAIPLWLSFTLVGALFYGAGMLFSLSTGKREANGAR